MRHAIASALGMHQVTAAVVYEVLCAPALIKPSGGKKPPLCLVKRVRQGRGDPTC